MSLKNPSDFFESENSTPGNVEEDVNDSAENNKSSLKKPSDFFGDNSVLLDDVEENIEEDLRDEIPDYEQLNPEQLDYFVAKIDFLSEQLSKKVDKTDLENSMVSQLETLEENITKLKSSYEGIGKIKNDLLREEFSNKLNSISESIDTNIELLNKKFEKSSLQLKRDIATYNSITKIVENKVEKLNDAETNVDNKIEEITTSVNDFISDLERQVDNKLKGAIKSYVTELKNKIDDVRYDIDNLQEFSFRSDISRLEKKIDYIRETYEKIDPESTARQVIEQALLDKTINSDPLSKDDFVTLPQLQEHYRLFLNRIQQQLSTFGGGGIEDAPKYDNGVFIRQGQRWKKFNEVGVQTFTGIHVDPNGIGTTAYPDASFVTVGDARVTGTLSIGTSSIVLNPEAASIGGISQINATSITAESGSFSGNVTIGGTLTYEDVTNVDSIGFVTARENVFVGKDVFVVGVITATSFYGNLLGTATTATNLNNQAASYYLDYNNFVGVATDADKLDGQQGTYYLDYNNFTNTPTIPTNNNELTNGAGYITTSFTNTNQLTNGAGFITSSDTVALAEGLTGTPNLSVGVVTATSFDGDLIGTATTATNLNNQAASYYLDYNNFTNTPTISTFSGDYNDLTNIPTIPSDTGDLTNNVGFITSGGSAQNLTSLTGASQGVYGNSGNTPQITVDSTGRITSIALVGISGGGGGGGGGLSGINFFNGQTSLGVSTHLSFGNNVTATSIGNTITVNVTGVVTSLSGYATEEYVNTSVASGISSVGIQSGGTSVGTAKTVNFGSSLTATVSGEVATVNVSIPLSALTDVNTSNLTGITTDYLMVYDPTIPGFKFVDPKTYFGINNDANPAADIVDYGDFG